MAGRKRSSDVPPTAKITKYFCSQDPSNGSYNAVFDSSTETERPEESESAGSAPSYESVAGGSNSTCESQSEAVHDLGHIIKSSMDSTEVCGP